MFKKFSLLAQLAKLAHRNEKGEVAVGGIIILGISMVFVAVGFIMFPIATSATDSILSYVYSGNATINTAYFTGLTPITGITPLLILLGFLASAVIYGIMGVKVVQGKSSAKVSPGALLVSGISIVFIAVGLIMFPVVLDGIASVVHGGGQGINAAYVGLAPILLIAPMLVLLAYVAATAVAGFFGIKTLGSGR
jgi:hypothetical protein